MTDTAPTQKPPLVTQPSAAPTRKVLVGAVAGVLAAGLNHALAALVGSHAVFAWLGDPDVRSAVPIAAAFGAAYLVRDRGAPAAPGAGDIVQLHPN